MKLTVRAFQGIKPVSATDLLKPGEAVVAQNVVLQGGDLDPLKATLKVADLTSTASTVKAIYRFNQAGASDTLYWFQSNNAANFVKGPIDGDTEERTYFTGHLNYPAKTKSGLATAGTPYPFTSPPMGLYKPASAPAAAVTGTPTDATAVAEDVCYVMTLVTDWGEEGPPSAVSNIVSWRPGQTIQLTLATSGVPSYPTNEVKSGTNYTKKRIYRSATGSSGSATFLLVNTDDNLAYATGTYADSHTTASLGEALKTTGWIEPPDDMLGLCQMANGMLAGYSGNTVCFCEPFTPYAWPVRYQQSVDGPINGIAAFGQSLLVSTSRSLYVFTGPDPSSVTSERLSEPQICISNRAMVPMLGGVVFPTPDGLGYVGPGGFRMLSDGLFSRREWAPFTTDPAAMHAYEIDGRYVLFYNNGAGGGLVFKFGDEPTLTTTSIYATAGFRDPGRDALFLCIPNGGTGREVHKWDMGSAMTMTWTSGVFTLPSPTNLGAARVSAAGSVSFEILADGVAQGSPITVTDSMPFKLPGGYRTQRVQFRLTGSSVVRSVEIGDTVRAIISG